MEDLTPYKCYEVLGFTPFQGPAEHVPADVWRRCQESKKLEDIRHRYLLRRDCIGQPIVDEGFIVGHVTANTLSQVEVEKLLSALTEAMARGCVNVQDWQELRAKR